jgi:hypothetical protein
MVGPTFLPAGLRPWVSVYLRPGCLPRGCLGAGQRRSDSSAPGTTRSKAKPRSLMASSSRFAGRQRGASDHGRSPVRTAGHAASSHVCAGHHVVHENCLTETMTVIPATVSTADRQAAEAELSWLAMPGRSTRRRCTRSASTSWPTSTQMARNPAMRRNRPRPPENCGSGTAGTAGSAWKDSSNPSTVPRSGR